MEVTPEQSEKIVKELYYAIPPSYSGGKIEKFQNAIPIRPGILSIPAGRRDLIPAGHDIVDKRVENKVYLPELRKKVVLRPDQLNAVKQRKENYIIVAPPAWGKTFTGVALIKDIGCKTLIVVHTKFLMQQWAEEIEYLLGIKPSIIGGRKKETEGPIIVGMVQTLRNMNMGKDLADIGTIVLDETHHIAATSFKETMDRCKAKHKIGLTATPERKDRKHFLLFDFIGRDLYMAEDSNSLAPTIYQLQSDIKLPGNMTMPWANRVNSLNKNPDYIKLLAGTAAIQVSKGHQVLLLSDRLDTIDQLHDILGDSFVKITSKNTNEERELAKQQILAGEKRGIVGSLKIFCEGVSINTLSCLILGSPINNDPLLEQVVGRVTRKLEDVNGISLKEKPVVIDIVLKGVTGKNQGAARRHFFIHKDWEVIDI